MFYTVCGPPSAHSIFASRLGSEILREAFGDFHHIYANNSSDLIKALRQRNNRCCMMYFDFPDEHASRLVVDKGIPTVLIAEPFEDIVLYCMAAWEMDLRAAVRFAARSVASLYPISSSRNVVPLRIANRIADLTHLIGVVSLSLGIELSDRNIGNIVDRHCRDDRDPEHLAELVCARVEHARAAAQQRAGLLPDELSLLERMTRNYQPLIDGLPVRNMEWPAGFCLDAERPERPADASIAMTGPARILSFGPYLHLPEGYWRAELRFSVKNNWSGNTILMDVLSGGEVLAEGKIELPANGLFSVSLPFEVAEAAAPLEVRSTMLSGAIEGEFQLLDVIVTQAEDAEQGEAGVVSERVSRYRTGEGVRPGQ